MSGAREGRSVLAIVRPDEGTRPGAGISKPPASFPYERSVYGASASAKPKAFIVTVLIHAVVIALLVVRSSGTYTVAKPSAPLVVTLQPLASPPEPEPAAKEKPVPEREKKTLPTPQQVAPVQRTVIPLAPPSPTPPPIDLPKADPAPRQADTAAPKAAPAPLAQQAQSNAPDSWEGRVLARLEKFRRYPGSARSARQQGVVYIRFRMNRDGHVLTSSIVRSSGSAALDQAALDTLRRADPLPKIPTDRPDEIEIAVPVEFYLR